MKLNLGQGLVVVGLAMGLAACGPKLQSVAEQDGSNTADPSRRETISVGVNISEKGFALANASTYTMRLEGCASGLTADITQAQAFVDVYKFDQGCVIKLTAFTYGGVTYEPTVGDPFNATHSAGDIATFADTLNPANQLTVTVGSQLNNPISGTEAVSYTFSQITAGAAETIAKTVVGDAHTLSVTGTDAANVDITGVTMTGMTAGGAGQFTFKVDCLVATTGTLPATLKCGANDLIGLKYRLIADNATYNGDLTYTQAAALFDGSETTVASGDQFSTGNGGFNALVTGPNQMHNNPNMLFVIQSGGAGGSYKYFNVDVTKLTYPN
jgi:hypothetical protein